MLNKISLQLEKLFEQPAQPQAAATETALKISAQQETLIEDNRALCHLSYVFSDGISSDNLLTLFDQLSYHFEGAWLCRKSSADGPYSVLKACFYAKSIAEKHLNRLPIASNLTLPQAHLLSVLKIPAHHFLRRAQLSEQLDPEMKMQAYVITLGVNHKLVLFSSLAEPWASVKIETLQQALLKVPFSL